MQKAPSASRPVPAVIDLGRPGKGLLVAAVLLLAVECYLHTDAFLHRYRSVFAAGRAVDKTAYAQRHCPAIVALAAVVVGVEPMLVRLAGRTGVGNWWRVPYWLRGSAYAGLVLTILAFGGATQKFIYFDF